MNATHVIIRGHVFTFEEKRPFAPSGKSILGAMEYDQETDCTRCHECGKWSRGLGMHINEHKISRAAYNAMHGLMPNSAISGMFLREKHRTAAARVADGGGGTSGSHFQERRKSHPTNKGKRYAKRAVELQNEDMRCMAQMAYQVQRLAATIGRTPGQADLRGAGISPGVLARRFGSLRKAMDACGLAPNDHGFHANPLPRGFPSKQEIEKRWNERMPWPADYFKTDHRFGVPSGAFA